MERGEDEVEVDATAAAAAAATADGGADALDDVAVVAAAFAMRNRARGCNVLDLMFGDSPKMRG